MINNKVVEIHNNSDYTRLLDKVRDKEVVLWIGAGFSRCAGFPSGYEMLQKIKSTCTQQEQKKLNEYNLLPDFTDKFVRLRGGKKTDLICILKDIFQVRITDEMLKNHKKLNNIPQIQTIITTNYDRLIEEAYGLDNIDIVRRDKDIPIVRKGKRRLYKIHSDFDNIEDLVITRQDYTKFFGEKMDSLLWSHIKSIISEKSILFIGYSLEDQNVDFLFQEIMNKLGDLLKESFVVIPDMEREEIRLLNSKGITYIDAKGEELIDVLEKDIKDTLCEDCNNGRVDFKTVKNIFRNEGVGLDFNIDGENVYLSSICKLPGDIEPDVKVKVSFSNHGKQKEFSEVMKNLYDVFKGKKFDTVNIPGEYVKTVRDDINGTKISQFGDRVQYKELICKPNPYEEVKCHMYFSDEEYEEIIMKWYLSKYLIQTEIQTKGFVFVIKDNLSEIEDNKFIVKDNKMTISFEERLNLIERNKSFKLLERWINGEEIKIYRSDDYSKVFKLPKIDERDKELILYIRQQSYIYTTLIQVQKYFGIKFETIDIASAEDLKSVIILNNYCNANGKISMSEIPIPLDKLSDIAFGNTKFKLDLYLSDRNESVNLLGKEIDLGRARVVCEDAYIKENLESNQYSDKSKMVVIKSESNNINIVYER